MKWQDVFLLDIAKKKEQAKAEYMQFKETQQLIYLQQAGNKLFSAVENYFMLKYNKRVKNYKQLQSLVLSNKEDHQLLFHAAQLHYFFYNADLQMDRIDAQVLFEDVLERFEKRDETVQVM